MARTSRDIRSANRLTVVQQVVAAGTTSRQRLAVDTGLSLGTVATLVAELTDLGLLTEAGQEDSGGGRPRGLVAADPHGGLLVGVDVAETYVHVDLFDTTLTRLAGAEEALRPLERRPHQVVRHIVSGIDTVLAGTGARVLGVGVSVPGQVDREGGVSVFAPNWNWHDVPLRDLLADHLPLPLHLDNPLRAAVLAELWAGAARGRDDVAVINLGTGVGAGLAFGGTLYRGSSNSAGEWGHTTLVLDGRLCRCGSRGCVEAYVGAPGIMQTLRDLAPTSPLLHPEDQTATLDALAAALAADDPTAAKVVAETARYLGVAVADLVNLLNPEVIVLSSWVADRLGDRLRDEVRAVVAQHALRRPLAATGIVRSPVAGNPVSLGAATLALEGFLTQGR
ncbi:sugar kinase [Micromonospora humidisoli]|uniref:ROK family protein n=1 Tax=Micromonospora humidisoli TaxID=2807622 RepID=A0ABS2JG48_9ACTN|nr:MULTISPECIES: ROK family protein [Micromonospora]MBM7085045.1 ROK family protein [Micromonospora humidisoli]GHJ08294.1 sugar kinase [Micromonospora sp. AKA109]